MIPNSNSAGERGQKSVEVDEGSCSTAALFEEEKARYASHIEHRKSLVQAQLEIAGKFTNASLTLSGGALALTITYVEKLRPHLEQIALGWLQVAWSCLALSLTASLLSLLFSLNAIQTAIKSSDVQYNCWLKDKTANFAKHSNQFSTWTGHFNLISVIGFALGVAAFLLFVLQAPPSSSH
jgi:hypothetical protein